MTAADRLSIFPEEHHQKILSARNGVLWCHACAKVINQKKCDTVKDHLKDVKHKENVVKMKTTRLRQDTILSAIHSIASESQIPGTVTVDRKNVLFRIDTVWTFMKAGIPLLRMRNPDTPLSDYLHRNTQLQLPTRQTLETLILAIHQEELNRICAEVQKKKVSLIFDGGYRNGDLLGVVARYVDDASWKIRQKVDQPQHLLWFVGWR